MIENNETREQSGDMMCTESGQSHTEAILMTTAATLVGFLMLYLMIFDGATPL